MKAAVSVKKEYDMKKLLCIFLCAILSVSLFGCASQKDKEIASDGKDGADYVDPDKVKSLYAFRIAQGQVLEFMESPSIDYLERYGYNSLVYTISPDDDSAVMIERLYDTSGWSMTVRDDEELQYGAMHDIRTELIRRLGSKAELNKLLKDSEIDGEVRNFAIVSTPQATDFLWIELNDRSCYAEIKYLGPDEERQYEIRLFSESEFKERMFGADGTVSVNGKNLGDKAYVNFFDKGVGFEVLPIIEELGAKIQRIDDSTVRIEYNGKGYTYYTDRGQLFEDGKTEDLLLVLMAGTSKISYTIDGKVIVDVLDMRTFAHLMGAELTIDGDTMTAEVNSV